MLNTEKVRWNKKKEIKQDAKEKPSKKCLEFEIYFNALFTAQCTVTYKGNAQEERIKCFFILEFCS